MDDRERLIQLLLLVAQPLQQRIPPGSLPPEDKTPHDAALRHLAEINDFLGNADEWHRSEGASGEVDSVYDLPAVAFQVTGRLPDETTELIGSWVQRHFSLNLANPFDLGKFWADDVRHTSWNLLVQQGYDVTGVWRHS